MVEGLCEVKQHMESKRHKDGAKAFTKQATMTPLLSQKKQSLNEQVTTAEMCILDLTING